MLTHASATAAGQDDLFSEEVSLRLPARLAVNGKIFGRSIRQLAVPATEAVCRPKPFTVRRVGGAVIRKLRTSWHDHRLQYDVRIVEPRLSRQAIGEEGPHPIAGGRDLSAGDARHAPAGHRQQVKPALVQPRRGAPEEKVTGAYVVTCVD